MTEKDPADLELIRKTTRELARKFDLEYWRQKDTKHEYPWEFVKAFADGGWLGAMIPEEYGGIGLGLVESAVMLHEIGYSGAGASGASAIHFYIFPPGPIIRHGSEEMKREFLPKIAKGELLMAFGVTEPSAGVDTPASPPCGEAGGRLGHQRAEGVDHQRSERPEDPSAGPYFPADRREADGRHDAVLHRSGPRAHHRP